MKFFDLIFGKNDKTKLLVKITYYDVTEDPNDNFVNLSTWPCSTAEEFEKLYLQIENERKNATLKLPEVKIKIEISGTLNGIKRKETFEDLASYRHFLDREIHSNKSQLQPK